MILSRTTVWATPHKRTTYKLLDQLKHILDIFSIYLPALNRYMELNKIWGYPLVIPIFPKSQTFIQLYLLVVIAVSFVYKYSKCRKKIWEIAEFIRYLSRTSPVFFNALQSQTYSCFIVRKIQMPIILQQNICCTAYPRNLCIRYINNKLFFLALPTGILAISITSYIAITLV